MSRLEGLEGWVTLYTDAGWHPVEGGTWAFAAIYGEPTCRLEQSGRVECIDSNVAEMAAIVLGIEQVRAVVPVDGFWIRSDSRTAIAALDRRASWHHRKDFRDWQLRMREAVLGVQVRMKWVPGHQRGTSVGAFLNNRVDQMASEARRSPQGREPDSAAQRIADELFPPK